MQSIKPVTLQIRWHELFGDNQHDIPSEQRRDRWQQWKAIAPINAVEYWTDTSACRDCIHRDADWCSAADLPCTVNPVLTFRQGLIGMACCGAGYEPRQPELLPTEDLF